MPLTLFSRLSEFCEWLDATALSQTIQKINWIIPTVQIIHILAIAAVAGSVLMINARLLCLTDLDQSLRNVAQRFLPVIWWALPVLLATGAIMIIAEPARALKNPVFQIKMVLIVLAVTHSGIFQAFLAGLPANVELTRGRRATPILIAASSLCLWIAIIFAGRWIAYF